LHSFVTFTVRIAISVWLWASDKVMVMARVGVRVRFGFGVTVRKCRDDNLATFLYWQPGGYTGLFIIIQEAERRLVVDKSAACGFVADLSAICREQVRDLLDLVECGKLCDPLTMRATSSAMKLADWCMKMRYIKCSFLYFYLTCS